MLSWAFSRSSAFTWRKHITATDASVSLKVDISHRHCAPAGPSITPTNERGHPSVMIGGSRRHTLIEVWLDSALDEFIILIWYHGSSGVQDDLLLYLCAFRQRCHHDV